jgi:hypothetical protein
MKPEESMTKPMNVADVEKHLAKIKEIEGDSEMAHCGEDALYTELLRSIAAGTCDDPAACAKRALTTKEMPFSRWCA